MGEFDRITIMKSLINSILTVFIGIFALAQVPVCAQQVRQTVRDELPAFSRIVLGGDFSLNIQYGKQYRARMGVEELFNEYVQFSVNDSTLTVSMDERKVPAEVRKLFRGSGRTPEFRIEVTMPETLRSLRLDGRASLVAADDLVFDPSSVSVQVTDNARIASAMLESKRVELDVDKKAQVTLEVSCDSLIVRQGGNSNLDVTHHAVASRFEAGANASLLVKGETGLLKLDGRGFSKSILNGKAPVMRCRAGGAAQVNAVSLETAQAFAEMSGMGSVLTTAATDDLTVDLSGGATVFFLNDPSIHVLYLKNASLIPYDRK